MHYESTKIDRSTEKSVYETLLKSMDSVLEPNIPVISNLSNFIAVLKDSFPKISWIGYYFLKNGSLYLGPFQGKVACTKIEVGSGVCGTVAEKKESLIVENVHKFSGHIACDSGSNSEIVLPIFNNGELIGVLDLDSYDFAAFTELDKIYMEKMLNLLSNKINFNTLNF